MNDAENFAFRKILDLISSFQDKSTSVEDLMSALEIYSSSVDWGDRAMEGVLFGYSNRIDLVTHTFNSDLIFYKVNALMDELKGSEVFLRYLRSVREIDF